jgi:starch-binding outer membrane protein, SusD/RagB family
LKTESAMNTTTRRTLAAAAALVMGGAAACTDLTVPPKSTVTAANIFNDPNSYRAYMAKLYAGLTVTGQQGPAGSADITSDDEGFSQYVRLYWQMQELPTDEAAIAWGDAGVQELNTQIWSSANQFLVMMYYRVFFQATHANEFLRETTDAKLTERGVSDALRSEIHQFRAEARYLRALSYWHGLDLFGDIPLVREDVLPGSPPPAQATRAEVYDFVVSELNEIRTQLPPHGTAQYGRASRAAADMLLAKLYLNAQVYTGTARWAEARAASEAVIAAGGGLALDDVYQHMFLADNHTSPEIVFAVTHDGVNTQSFGGTSFLAHASVGGSMNQEDYGLNGGWWGLRLRPEVATLFPAGDGRAAVFYRTDQTLQITNLLNFQEGIAAPKYQNVTSTGQPGSDREYVDTDYPMFRLADAYLMYAEAVLRGGGGTRGQAYVNALRRRAYGDASGDIADGQLTLAFILSERARELYWEGHRRQDLIRYDLFSDNGVWTFKGGVQAGRTTESFRDLYPLPASELLANPNLEQNPGYPL